MDLASLRAISVCLFVVAIAALDPTPCHMPREYTGASGRLRFTRQKPARPKLLWESWTSPWCSAQEQGQPFAKACHSLCLSQGIGMGGDIHERAPFSKKPLLKARAQL